MARPPRDGTALLLAVPLALAVAACARVLPAEFVFDDSASVVLAPTSSAVPVDDLLVEHRAYLASWGVVLATVAARERVASRVPWRTPRGRWP